MSNDDWFSFIYNGNTLTGYRSRNKSGYEINIDGIGIELDDLSNSLRELVVELIGKFTPIENPEKKKLETIISHLQAQLLASQTELNNLS